eukprot:6213343-Pleurochrysis_carterae.AAC.8
MQLLAGSKRESAARQVSRHLGVLLLRLPVHSLAALPTHGAANKRDWEPAEARASRLIERGDRITQIYAKPSRTYAAVPRTRALRLSRNCAAVASIPRRRCTQPRGASARCGAACLLAKARWLLCLLLALARRAHRAGLVVCAHDATRG